MPASWYFPGGRCSFWGPVRMSQSCFVWGKLHWSCDFSYLSNFKILAFLDYSFVYCLRHLSLAWVHQCLKSKYKIKLLYGSFVTFHCNDILGCVYLVFAALWFSLHLGGTSSNLTLLTCRSSNPHTFAPVSYLAFYSIVRATTCDFTVLAWPFASVWFFFGTFTLAKG